MEVVAVQLLSTVLVECSGEVFSLLCADLPGITYRASALISGRRYVLISGGRYAVISGSRYDLVSGSQFNQRRTRLGVACRVSPCSLPYSPL